MNILYLDLFDVCQNCGAQHQKFSEIPNYEEDDKSQTNVLYNQKKIHMPYEYLKETYPEIKLIKIYDYILESIDEIKKFYKHKDRHFKKYVPYLYNYYKMKNNNIKNIEKFKKEKNLYIEEELFKKINEIHNKYSDNIDEDIETIIKKLVIDDKQSSKYYHFNKTKNRYFKKTRYCQFEDCTKIGNYKIDNINYCKQHSITNSVDINNKLISKKCKYKDCKRKSTIDYCTNHKHKCVDNEFNIRIMKSDSYCKVHR